MLVLGLSICEDCFVGVWVVIVIGLFFLVFDFYWVNGDCFFVNLFLGGGMVLVVVGGYFSFEGCFVVG